VAPRLRSCMAAHLIDRREARLESVAGGAEVETPYAHALGAGQVRAFADFVVEPLGPVPQRLGVVVLEALDVLDLEAGTLERQLDARQRQRITLPEGRALRARARFGGVRAQTCDAVVQQTAARREQVAQLTRVD